MQRSESGLSRDNDSIGVGGDGDVISAAGTEQEERIIGHKRSRQNNAEDAKAELATSGKGDEDEAGSAVDDAKMQLRGFIACSGFSGVKPGYVFRSGDQGVGYYLDEKHCAQSPAASTSVSVESEQPAKQQRAAVDVDAALAKIAPALASDKKFAKAAELLQQLMAAEMVEGNAQQFFDVIHTLLATCDRDVRASGFRDVYIRLVDAFYQKMLPLATEEQAFMTLTWRCRCCTANLMYTDDSFQLAKACKQLSEALEGVQNDSSLMHIDRRLAVLEAMRAAFPLHERAWARPSIESSFKIATEKRLCFEDEIVDAQAVKMSLYQAHSDRRRTEGLENHKENDVQTRHERVGAVAVDGGASGTSNTPRAEVDEFTSEIVARQRKRGVIGQQTVRTHNSTAHPLLTKRQGVLR